MILDSGNSASLNECVDVVAHEQTHTPNPYSAGNPRMSPAKIFPAENDSVIAHCCAVMYNTPLMEVDRYEKLVVY
jgi:hypothetical protein